jgi:dipeptidyl aminopeptidase/acylaminoacyl peptidase
MIENDEDATSYLQYPPHPKADPTDQDEEDQTALQPASTKPAFTGTTSVHQSAPSVSTQPPIEPATGTIQIPASTVSPQHENSSHAIATPALPSMSINDLLALKIVSDPQISPDGTMVAFVLQNNNIEHNTTGSSIWLVSSTGGKNHPSRQLTSGIHHDTMPRWSPNGHTLAFLSDRIGKPQLYLLPMHGGEIQQISSLRHDITEYSWHPGGRLLLAHSYWKLADDEHEHETAKTPAQLTTSYKHLEQQYNGIGDKHGRHLQLWLIPLGGKATRLTSEPIDLVQSCWSPDGAKIVFCANRRPNPDLSASMALWILTLATGQLRRLTPEEGVALMPAWSPNSQYIAYLYSPDQTKASNTSPWFVAAHGSPTPQPVIPGPENLTCQTELLDELHTDWIDRPQWYPDSTSLLVPVQERGQVHLYRLDREQHTSQQLTHGNGRYASPQLSKNGQMVTMVRTDWFTPGDVWSMDSTGNNLRKLTRVNDAILQSRQLTRPKRITWQSFDGTPIEGWLYLPLQAGQAKVPLILAPHGGPSLAWGDSYIHEFQVLTGHGYAVLAPNPRGSAGYGEAFSHKVINDWGGDDLQDLMTGLDYVIAHEPIDEQRLGINGFSYGGYMANWAITQTNRFKAAVSRNGLSSIPTAALLTDLTVWFKLSMEDETLQRDRSPLTFVENITTPLLLLHADQDLRCPFSESLQLFVALRKRKHTVELVRYHHVSHLMDWPTVGTPKQRIDRLQRTIEWFDRFL